MQQPDQFAAETVVIAACIDERFAVPLLVTLRSAALNLHPGWRMAVHVIGIRLPGRAKRRITEGLGELPVDIAWLSLDLSAVRQHWPGIRTDGDLASYARLYVGDLLPAAVDRVLYLDADLLIEGDLTGLWESPFNSGIVQAVPDAYAAFLHSPRLCRVGRFPDGRFAANQPYFNSGVMLIDLEKWRDQGVRSRMESLLWEYGDALFMRDQDALNVALAGRWKPLPPAWNFHELPALLSRWSIPDVAEEQLREAFYTPRLIHYVGRKPWNARCANVHADRWWRVAGPLHVEREPLSFSARCWHRLIRAPHARLNWHIWREWVQLRDFSRWRQPAALLVAHPWVILTYPLWQAAVHIRAGAMRLRRRRR